MSSLDAAIEGGADAVYLGGAAMNARIHAGNFSSEQLREAVKKAHSYGVKVYFTLNTLVTDRELPVFLAAAWDAAEAGVNALIVSDLGGAAAIHREIPSLELHASTQMSGHNAEMAKELAAQGFSRMVAAREISKENLQLLLQRSPIETELFVHGALCVCHSGQCLFSSLVGGRSGNRGDCAQPCRLPYRVGGKESYPLSLKDLCLAEHIPELIGMGVASFKIEGRMKSPEYVRDTAKVWRKLLDEGRAASPEEMRKLAETFSRGGFTDGYFTGNLSHKMLGVRQETDKEKTRALEPFAGLLRKIPLDLTATLAKDTPVRLSLSDGTHTVTVTGAIPEPARTAPLSEGTVAKQLCKFGGTPYVAKRISTQIDPGLMLPLSALNDLRRRALEALAETIAPPAREGKHTAPAIPSGKRTQMRTARFADPSQIPESARRWFDRIYLPLDRFDGTIEGVVLPPVLFDQELEGMRRMLADAVGRGARYALIGNLGHLSLVCEAGLIPVADYRFNIANAGTVAFLEEIGFSEQILSPELSLPQMRDIGGNTAAIVYGRIPLMTLEKCIGKELADCNACNAGKVTLRDRKGIEFPVLREWEHRSVIYNSVPTCMSDRQDALLRAGLISQHFLFTVETESEVREILRAFERQTAPGFPVRRIASGT